MIQIAPDEFDNLLRNASFQVNGDVYEQNYGDLIAHMFPNCELFWKLFVVPLTERISGYPNPLTGNIRPRNEVNHQLENIANTYYTTFLNLVYAHLHLQHNIISSLENFYAHLGSACDLVETFLERWFFLLLKCREGNCDTLQKLEREDFLQIAGEWYDENYPNIYSHYLSKGKSIPIYIPSRKNILKEFFGNFLQNDNLRKRYIRLSQSIRQFRNVVVHDVQIGSLQDANGNRLIPMPKTIGKYRTWRQVFSVAGNTEVINRDFRPMNQQMENDITELEGLLNEIWELIIQEFLLEFYSLERKTLRDMYLIAI